MQSHVTVKSWYIFKLAMTEVALHRLDIACSRGCGRGAATRSARRPASTRTIRSFLTALLRL